MDQQKEFEDLYLDYYNTCECCGKYIGYENVQYCTNCVKKAEIEKICSRCHTIINKSNVPLNFKIYIMKNKIEYCIKCLKLS